MMRIPNKQIIGIALVFFGVAGALFFSWGFFMKGESSLSQTMEATSEGAAANHELEVTIAENGESLGTSSQDALEEQFEQDAETVAIIDEPEGAEDELPLPADVSEEKPSVTDPSVLPPPKKGKEKELRIGFVTDTHVKSSSVGDARVLGQKYRDRIGYFITRMNNDFGADILVANGDIIEGTRQTSDVGMSELSLVKDIFDRTSIPTQWVIGNHDLRAVTKKQWKSALGIRYEYKAFDVKQYRVFILDSNFTSQGESVAPKHSYTRGRVSQEQVEWLEKELKKTKKRPIVFMHHPPLRDIDGRSNESLLKSALDLRSVFAENGVFAVFSGHIEDVYYEETDGVKYFVLPGLVKHPQYQGTFAEISVTGDTIEVDMSYLKKDGTYRTVRMQPE